MRYPSRVKTQQRAIVLEAIQREIVGARGHEHTYQCEVCDALRALAKKFDIDIDILWEEKRHV